ncbi:16S rRNA (cytosine(1402)-N(4))-methyltransferase RsmH [Bacteroides propionicifaciens]|jgi:16S rRNA (cytosine1402-N4)-methyltransferase|uniref:16S rRNA (cytosine(1402)-N(4))-methyltransferase RsmH n=1 Tax=Bacteroides propionicifaciens TaxID=392838 RepID=UPI00036BCD49|nr:16S rRNA (cytosine(1402)-N(4))-methyltransferase RsmH [Bacteroides propionicifaciens]
MNNDTYHIPVLLEESIAGLNINPQGNYVDVTFGGGGHSKEILKNLVTPGHLYAFDQDADAERNIIDDECFTFVRSNFRYIKNFLRYHNVEEVDGILADLGVSSHHFDEEERGFSFRFDAPLDMRMNTRATKTAADIINNYTQDDLADVFYLYGEFRNSRQIASKIVRARAESPILTISQFIELTTPLFKPQRLKKELAKAFQALRIEVNQEMQALKEMLEGAIKVLKPGGRLVVITYHSLEDRMVKNLFKTGNIEGKLEKDFYGKVISPIKAINNKVIIPSDTELNRNPRSRSAKLRIAEKL